MLDCQLSKYVAKKKLQMKQHPESENNIEMVIDFFKNHEYLSLAYCKIALKISDENMDY